MTNNERKWAIVTGGNRGLGLETCRQLAQKRYHVVLTARDLAQAQSAAETLASAGAVQAAQLNVTDEASVRAFAELAKASFGPLHALVNNAGISMKGFDVDVVRGTLGVNFFGALRVTQALSPLVVDGGNVVMVSTEWASSTLTRRRSRRASWMKRSASMACWRSWASSKRA